MGEISNERQVSQFAVQISMASFFLLDILLLSWNKTNENDDQLSIFTAEIIVLFSFCLSEQ